MKKIIITTLLFVIGLASHAKGNHGGYSTSPYGQTLAIELPAPEVLQSNLWFSQGSNITLIPTYYYNGTATILKYYATEFGGTALTGVALQPGKNFTGTGTRTYYVSQTDGVNTSPRTSFMVTVFALPATPTELVLTNDTAVSPATTKTPITAVGVYVGADVTLKLTTTTVAVANYYIWSLPAGVTLESTDYLVNTVLPGWAGTVITTGNSINVKFSASADTSSLKISVKSADRLGGPGLDSTIFHSAPKTLTLTRAIPTAPAKLTMNNGLNLTPITSFAKYMGTNTVLRLSAAVSATAASYDWVLPTGVTRVTGLHDWMPIESVNSIDPFIYVTFQGLNSSDTYNYYTAATVPVSTNVLRIGVYGRNGIGVSSTANGALANPATSSTARLLTLTAVAPAAPANIKMYYWDPIKQTSTVVTDVSKYIGTDTEFTLVAATSAIASSYAWDLPDAVIPVYNSYTIPGYVYDPNSNRINVRFEWGSGIIGGTLTTNAQFTFLIGVRAVNGVGASVKANTAYPGITATLLPVTAANPAAPTNLKMYDLAVSSTVAVTDVSKYIGTDTELTLIAAKSALANKYSWWLPDGVNTSDLDPFYNSFSNTIKVNFLNVPHENSAFTLLLGARAVNAIGESVKVNTAYPGVLHTLLPLTASPPAAVATPTGTLKICASTASSVTYTIAAVAKNALDYVIFVSDVGSLTELPNANPAYFIGDYGQVTYTKFIHAVAGATFTVYFPAGYIATTQEPKSIHIQSINHVGYTEKVLPLTNVGAVCGSRTASSTKEIQVVASAQVYPNPTSGEFSIELNAATASTVSMTITSLAGSIVSSKNIALTEGNNVINENISSLTNGVYVVTLVNATTAEVITNKIIKE